MADGLYENMQKDVIHIHICMYVLKCGLTSDVWQVLPTKYFILVLFKITPLLAAVAFFEFYYYLQRIM